MSDSQGGSLLAVAVSASLFVGTALCFVRKQQRETDPRLPITTQPITPDDAYYLRRMEDRLSFHNGSMDYTHDLDDINEFLDIDNSNNVDFYPKNSNWSHFDLEQATTPTTRSSSAGAAPKRQISLEGDESVVASSEFVWMSTTPKRGKAVVEMPSLPTIMSHEELQEPPLACPQTTTTTLTPTRTNKNNNSNHHRQKSHPTVIRTDSLDDRTLFGDGHDEPTPVIRNGRNHASTSTLSPPKRSISQPIILDNNTNNNHHSTSIRDYDKSLTNMVRRHNRVARSHYNARIMPNRVILIRHGQSMGNRDEKLYATIPDNAMPLTKLGWEQARAAGQHLKDLLNGESVHFIVSPYVRTVETFHGMASAWCDPAQFTHIGDREARLEAWYSRLLECHLTWHEDPRIREQDFGNLQQSDVIKQAKKDRHAFGAFYYRFPHGESASDVFDRISTFLDSLWRSFDMNKSRNYVLITHGISIRVLLARYFRYTISQFNLMANPRNCEMVVLEHDGHGRLQLNGRYELELQEDEMTKETKVVGSIYHKRLKLLSEDYVRKVHIRISYDD